ncbi:MAG: hydrogenase maturation nickel metallochaperone HypA [Methylophilaceae bacterium]|nr:hydrogenase maturation nickel metallochaperone HypA [Methylophilaceae bacterium]
MHELSLAEHVLQLMEEAAARQGFSRVRGVWLEIGQLAAVEVEALRFAFESVARGSLADGAALHVIELPGQGWCARCAATVHVGEQPAACPRCGSPGVQILGGTEMRVKELEVE